MRLILGLIVLGTILIAGCDESFENRDITFSQNFEDISPSIDQTIDTSFWVRVADNSDTTFVSMIENAKVESVLFEIVEGDSGYFNGFLYMVDPSIEAQTSIVEFSDFEIKKGNRQMVNLDSTISIEMGQMITEKHLIGFKLIGQLSSKSKFSAKIQVFATVKINRLGDLSI